MADPSREPPSGAGDLDTIVGVVLAGGRARRMGGGDKGLLPLGDRPLLAHVIGRFAPQVARLALNANGDPKRFAAFGLPVIADLAGAPAGPLAGMLAAMDWAAGDPTVRWVATVPVDTPFLPRDLVARLHGGLGNRQATVARSRNRTHPVIGLWDIGRAGDLASWLEAGSRRKVEDWALSRDCAVIDFPDDGLDPFFNVNTPEDLRLAVRHVEDTRRSA